MADTTFVDRVTPITAEWLNDVNNAVYNATLPSGAALLSSVIQKETQTATAGQTVFEMTTMTYSPGVNNLWVYVNGVLQNRITDYTETNVTTVTFTSGLNLSDEVQFIAVKNTAATSVLAENVSYTPAGAGAVGTNAQVKLRESVSVKDFGAVGDGVADDTAAFSAAVTFSEISNARRIIVPSGVYKLSSTISMQNGIRFEGENGGGGMSGYGTVILHATNNANCFEWDGNGPNSAVGVGGGLRNLSIYKAAANSGGDAIKLLATDDNHRPGEMVFENIHVGGISSSTWTRAFHADGTACITPGSKGVRSLFFRKFRATGCSQNNQYMYFNQVVTVFGELQADQGTGTGTVGITVAGDSDHFQPAVRISGNLIINDPTTDGVAYYDIRGHVGSSFDNNNEDAQGVVSLSGLTSVTNASPRLRVLSPKTDRFHAFFIDDVLNVTGDNTLYTVLCSSELFDDNSSYDTGTGKWTVKCAGRYHVTARLASFGFDSTNTRAEYRLHHKNSGGSTLTERANLFNPFPIIDTSGNCYGSVDGVFEMNEGDTMELQFRVSNGSGGGNKVADISGRQGGTVHRTFFAAYPV
jgi:hypothetical protein